MINDYDMLPGPSIKVIGVGDGGLRALNRIEKAEIVGIELIAIAKNFIGLAGCKIETQFTIDDKSEEDIDNWLNTQLEKTDLVFILADLGCKFASTYAEKIADTANRNNIGLTVSVVSWPYSFEGPQREDIAAKSLEKLSEKSDSIIVINSDSLVADIIKDITLEEAYDLSAGKIKDAVEEISQMVTVQGTICVDFADVKTIMQKSGISHFASICADNTEFAATKIKEELSKDLKHGKTRGMLATFITYEKKIGLKELNQGMIIIRDMISEEGNLIFTHIVSGNESLANKVKISVIAIQ